MATYAIDLDAKGRIKTWGGLPVKLFPRAIVTRFGDGTEVIISRAVIEKWSRELTREALDSALDNSIEVTISRNPDGTEQRVRTEPGGFAGTQWSEPYTVAPTCQNHLVEIRYTMNGDFCAGCGHRLTLAETIRLTETPARHALPDCVDGFAPAGSKAHQESESDETEFDEDEDALEEAARAYDCRCGAMRLIGNGIVHAGDCVCS